MTFGRVDHRRLHHAATRLAANQKPVPARAVRPLAPRPGQLSRCRQKKGIFKKPSQGPLKNPAFFNTGYKSIIQQDTFGVKDWESAMGMLSNLGREMEVIELGNGLLKKNILR